MRTQGFEGEGAYSEISSVKVYLEALLWVRH